MNDMQNILRKNLRYLRIKNHITQEKMAKLLEINTKSSISEIENGRKTIKGCYRNLIADQLILMNKLFKISTDKLLFVDLEERDGE